MSNGRRKGLSFERQVARLFRDAGYLAARNMQFDNKRGKGDKGDVTVVGFLRIGRLGNELPKRDIHFEIECKKMKKGKMPKWLVKLMEQAELPIADNGGRPLAVVKEDYGEAYAILHLDDLLRLLTP